MPLFERAQDYAQAFGILCAGIIVSVFICSHSVQAVDLPTTATILICGDGVVQTTEEVCDDGTGNNLGEYGSSTAERHCAPGCASFGPYCGDGILQARYEEECDDADTDDTDLCNTQCEALASVPPGGGGAPQVGSTPNIPGGTQGVITSQT